MRKNGSMVADNIQKSTITTVSDPRALNYQEVDEFLQMAYESTEFLKGIRTVTRRSTSGTIDKIGVTGRNLRSKKENVLVSNGAEPKMSSVPYSTEPIILPWDITEEQIRQEQRVRGQDYEDIILQGMTKNFGENMQDLGFNGDKSTPNTDPDYDFLKINDGWLKKARLTGNYIDWNTLPDADKMGVLFNLERAIPTRLRASGTFKYFMHPNTYSQRLEYLAKMDTSASVQIQIMGAQNKINSYEVEEVPHMPEGTILFTYKPNFLLVNTYDIIIRKTTEGKEAVWGDKRFYAIHTDMDSIFEEPAAVALVEGVKF